MHTLLHQAYDYVQKVKKKKFRLIGAVIITICLFAISCCYLYSGINKRFFLYTILCILTGAFFVCPRPENYFLRGLFLLLYIIAVPYKMFQRMELPVHDLSGMLDNAQLVNILIILLIHAFFLLIFQKANLALGGSSILLLVLLVLNYYCYQSHGTGLSIHNWKILGTALPIISGSRPIMIGELWHSILYFAFFIVFGFWCAAPSLKKRTRHLAATLISVGFFTFFYCFWNVFGFPEKSNLPGQYKNAWEVQLQNGLLISFFSDVVNPSDHQEKWYEKFPVVCHALGVTEDGAGDTNSRDALEYSYSCGQRVFETDISIASDNVAVLRHDWDTELGQAESFGWTENSHLIPSSSDFLQALIYGKYTPMTLLDLYEVMDEKKDMYVIIDPKYNSDVIGQFTILVNTAIDNGYESVLDRIVVQIYYEQMYDSVEEVYHFKNYLYTLYYIGYPGSDSVGTFCQKNNIPVVVMPYTDINDTYCNELHDYSLRVYGHTIDEADDAQKMISLGADGIYTDCILPKDMRAWIMRAALLSAQAE